MIAFAISFLKTATASSEGSYSEKMLSINYLTKVGNGLSSRPEVAFWLGSWIARS